METASKSKVTRAAAVSFLYERGPSRTYRACRGSKASCELSSDRDRRRDGSPFDAAVHALERLRQVKHVIVV